MKTKRKPIGTWLLVLVMIAMSILPYSTAVATDDVPELATESKSAILIDAESGTVLYEKNSDTKLPPASITKIMALLLVMEAIEDGQIRWDDQVRTSEHAASMGGSQIFLEIGEVMSVEEMVKGVAIASANDATVALAEHIAGSEEQFVEMMNEKASELGMQNTNFVNTNGLPADNHYTTARDIATMSQALLRHEDITTYTSVYEDYLREDSDDPFWLVNTNRLVKFYDGMDGLKTGYTSEAKYCLAATAKRNNLRTIAVVMGVDSPKVRNNEIVRLMDYAFNQYEAFPLYAEGEEMGIVQIDKGMDAESTLVAPRDISVLIRKGEDTADLHTTLHHPSSIAAPVEAGTPLATLTVQKGEETVLEVEIPAYEEIPKATFWQLWKRNLTNMF